MAQKDLEIEGNAKQPNAGPGWPNTSLRFPDAGRLNVCELISQISM